MRANSHGRQKEDLCVLYNGLSYVLGYTVMVEFLRSPKGYRNMLSTISLITRVQDLERSLVPKIYYDKRLGKPDVL
jgi:hypothetical protein